MANFRTQSNNQDNSSFGRASIDRPLAGDLFAGCGGMSLGLEKAGFKIAFANELNPDAAKTYRANFPHVNLLRCDIRKIDLDKLKPSLRGATLDLLVAGLPCQGFSIAGERNPRDPRNKLFKQMLRFVDYFRPRIVVMENVKGMLSMQGGRVIRLITRSLERLGYRVYQKVLNASDYGVPQNRERLFLIATLLDIPESQLFPRRSPRKVTTADAISDLEFLGVGEFSIEHRMRPLGHYQRSMRKRSLVLHNHQSPKHSSEVQQRFAKIPPGKNGKELLLKLGIRKHTYFRMDPTKVSRTITTLPEDFIHYRQNRIPTVRELARLQSFPDHFLFLGPRTTGGSGRKRSCPQYTQVGNAVPPHLSHSVMRRLMNALERHYFQVEAVAECQDSVTSCEPTFSMDGLAEADVSVASN